MALRLMCRSLANMNGDWQRDQFRASRDLIPEGADEDAFIPNSMWGGNGLDARATLQAQAFRWILAA